MLVEREQTGIVSEPCLEAVDLMVGTPVRKVAEFLYTADRAHTSHSADVVLATL